MMTFKQHLKAIGACQEARVWAGDRTAKEAWEQCERADWLLWWAAKDGASKQEIVLVACAIARTVLHLTKDPRALAAIEAAERWADDPSEENRRKARAAAADAAAYAAYAADAAYAAADAAADAADAAAADAAYAAADAAYAADAAAYAAADAAADADAADAARAESHANSLALIRSRLAQPWSEDFTVEATK